MNTKEHPYDHLTGGTCKREAPAPAPELHKRPVRPPKRQRTLEQTTSVLTFARAISEVMVRGEVNDLKLHRLARPLVILCLDLGKRSYSWRDRGYDWKLVIENERVRIDRRPV